jgi:hypothetical protein
VGEAIGSIPKTAANFTINTKDNYNVISNAISDYHDDKIDGTKASLKVAKAILGTGADAAGVAFSTLAPVVSPVLSQVLSTSGLTDRSQAGQNKVFGGLADALGFQGEQKQDLVDALKSAAAIASTVLGMKGGKQAMSGASKFSE